MLRFALLSLFLVASAHGAANATRTLLLDGAVAGSSLLAVGELGTILRSDDSGQTWATVASPTKATLTGIAFAADGRTGWAVGHDAIILATTDGGASWTQQWQGEDLESSFLDVCAIDAQHVIAIGAYGLCQTTSDGGRTWTSKHVLEADMHLNRITRGPTGTLYLAGERGTLLRSRNQGETWEPIESPYDGSFYGILPLDDHTLLAHGLRGRVFRSTDDGGAWTPVPLDRPMLIATALKTKSGAIVLSGQAGALYLSRDAGQSFAPWSADFDTAAAELIEAPDGAIVALGEAGASRLSAP